MPAHYTRVTLTCTTCGAAFAVIACRATTAMYCSVRCRGFRGVSRHRHGEARHNGKQTPEYSIWGSMRARCTNPRVTSYPNYGGRGITVCDRWQTFENFLSDMGRRPSPDHSLDRTDNDGNYEPGNVAWRTRQEQVNNRRVTRMITFNGVTQPIAVWAMEVGLPRTALSQRLDHGWSPERALTTPLAVRRRR